MNPLLERLFRYTASEIDYQCHQNVRNAFRKANRHFRSAKDHSEKAVAALADDAPTGD